MKGICHAREMGLIQVEKKEVSYEICALILGSERCVPSMGNDPAEHRGVSEPVIVQR